ncbi:MAG: hypothetical protein AAF385_10780 [Pseudomonadota bacterium]
MITTAYAVRLSAKFCIVVNTVLAGVEESYLTAVAAYSARCADAGESGTAVRAIAILDATVLKRQFRVVG